MKRLSSLFPVLLDAATLAARSGAIAASLLQSPCRSRLNPPIAILPAEVWIYPPAHDGIAV